MMMSKNVKGCCDPTGLHKFVNGKCRRCGDVEPTTKKQDKLFAVVAVATVTAGTVVGLALQDPTNDTPSDTTNVSRYEETDALFDCRVDGNKICGPNATVPVPDNGAIVYVPWDTAPFPYWRLGGS